MKSVLVIGSEGFIGKEVVKQLENENYNVVKFDKKLNPNNDTLFHDFVLDYEYDYVINLAGLVGLKLCLDNPINAVYQNILGVTRVLDAMKNSDTKIIHISTWAVEGNLINPYDVTKLAGENMTMSYIKRGLIKGCVCRLGTTYGPGMSKLGVIPSMLKKLKENKPLVIYGRGEQIRQFTYISDTASGIIKVMESGENGELYHVVSDEITSIKQIADSISEDIEYEKSREGDEKYTVLNNKKLKEFGWKPKINFKKGVELMKNG